MPANIILNISFPSGTTPVTNGISAATAPYWYVAHQGGLYNRGPYSFPELVLTVPKNPNFYFEVVASGNAPAASGIILSVNPLWASSSQHMEFRTSIGKLRTIEYYERVGPGTSSTKVASGVYDVGSGSWTFTGTNQNGWWSTRIICSGTPDSVYFKVGTATTFAYALTFTSSGTTTKTLSSFTDKLRIQYYSSGVFALQSGIPVPGTLSPPASGQFRISNIYYGKKTYSTGPVYGAVNNQQAGEIIGGVFNGGGVGSGDNIINPTYGLPNYEDNITPDVAPRGVFLVGMLPITDDNFTSSNNLRPQDEQNPEEPIGD